MHPEAKETARLYSVLTEKLGGDITRAMFKYIDNKTERAVEATIKTLATKDDIANVRHDLSREIVEVKTGTIKWMFFFSLAQVCSTFIICWLFLKK